MPQVVGLVDTELAEAARSGDADALDALVAECLPLVYSIVRRSLRASSDVDDVVQTLTGRPGFQHVVVTGRRADPKLVAAADLVTEMGKVKHPMDAGQKGQKGIEW